MVTVLPGKKKKHSDARRLMTQNFEHFKTAKITTGKKAHPGEFARTTNSKNSILDLDNIFFPNGVDDSYYSATYFFRIGMHVFFNGVLLKI